MVLPVGDGYVRQMWGYIWSELLRAISTEPEPDVKVLLMESCARVRCTTFLVVDKSTKGVTIAFH